MKQIVSVKKVLTRKHIDDRHENGVGNQCNHLSLATEIRLPRGMTTKNDDGEEWTAHCGQAAGGVVVRSGVLLGSCVGDGVVGGPAFESADVGVAVGVVALLGQHHGNAA